MKKLNRILLLGTVLALLLATPALAQSTAVSVDGKTYVFYGDQSVYQEDGKTFVIEDGQIRVQEPGRTDRVFPLEQSQDALLMEDVSPGSWQSTTDYDVAIAEEAGPQTTVEAENGYAISPVEDQSYAKTMDYDRYAKYGLSYDAEQKAMYYQGQRVRVFEDSYSLDGNTMCAAEHFDPAGVVDIKAIRDLSDIIYNADGSYDPSGKLTGLRALSAEEFAARDLTPWTNPPRTTVASSGEPMTAAEKQAFYAPYTEYGVLYDAKTDRLTYQNQLVRSFLDVFQSNGEPFSSGRFKGSMTTMTNDTGEIDITILRDYQTLDQNGNGKIVGVRVEKAN